MEREGAEKRAGTSGGLFLGGCREQDAAVQEMEEPLKDGRQGCAHGRDA